MNNESSPNAPRTWAERFLPPAEQGNLEAQMAVGWAYFRGEHFPRDLEAAEKWFRRAATNDEEGFFQLIKMLIIEKNKKAHDVYGEREWRLGSIDMIYAQYLIRTGASDSIVKPILVKAASKGNLYANLGLHSVGHRGFRRILGLPREGRILLQIFRAYLSNGQDERLRYR